MKSELKIGPTDNILSFTLLHVYESHPCRLSVTSQEYNNDIGRGLPQLNHFSSLPFF